MKAFRDEAKLQDAICKQLRKEFPGIWIFHPVGGPYQKPGIPDLLICWAGAFVALELKNPHPGESDESARERATPLQRKEICAINGAGGTGRVVLTVEEAVGAVRSAARKRAQKAAEANETGDPSGS